MAVNIAIPQIGMTMTEATITGWRVSEGEWVEEGQVVADIETEKISSELQATASGFVHRLVQADNKVNVSRVVGLLAKTKEELTALQSEPATERYASMEVGGAPVVGPASEAPANDLEKGQIRISPVARRMAEEQSIDITRVTGTGPGGRIVREDIEKAIAAKKLEEGKNTQRKIEAPTVANLHQGKIVRSSEPLKGMRKSIAEHMQRSLAVSAQVTNMGEIDMARAVNLRDKLVAQEKSIGARITYSHISVLVCAKALKDNPRINSSLIEDEIKIWEDVNVGLAVALGGEGDEGLIVPVIKNADRKSLLQIATEATALVEKARTRKLSPDDVVGGTFTVTNLGAVGTGWGFQTPIINQPQSAILCLGAITDRPVVRDGQIVIRPVMTCSFTYDHRVIDGAVASRFMARVAQLLENPELLLV